MQITNFGWAPQHDPIYGIRRENIATRLTKNNWKCKAVCRIIDDRTLYVMVRRNEPDESSRTEQRYYVQVHLGMQSDQDFNTDFETLPEALAYANGQDGSAFSRRTQPAPRGAYPENRRADTWITGYGGWGPKGLPNLTLTLQDLLDNVDEQGSDK